MNNGKIEQIGTPEEIYNNPSNSFVADFIGTTNIIKLDGKEIMVRPEDLTLLKSKESNLTNYRVKNIEFRGNSYRVTLNDKNNSLLVDVVAKEFKKLSIKENDIMQIEIADKLSEKVG